MTPNGQALDAPVDPADPASLIRWTARAAAAFEDIRGDVRELKEAFKASDQRSTEFRLGMEARMATGSRTMEDHGRRLGEIEGVHRSPGNPGTFEAPKAKPDVNGKGEITAKWLLEKVALPLLMSGAGAAIALFVAKGMYAP